MERVGGGMDGGRTEVRPAEGVLARHADGRVLLVKVKDGAYFALEEVGARIWELLADGLAPSGIVARLTDEYDAPEAAIRRDVDRFLEELRHEGLVVGTAPSS